VPALLYTPVVRSLSHRRRRWLLLHASLSVLVSLLATGVWLLSRGYDTNFWPGFVMLLLLIPLGLHAAVVLSGPARAPTPPPQAAGDGEWARSVGDRRWGELLDTHDRLARELVGQLQGRLVKSSRTTCSRTAASTPSRASAASGGCSRSAPDLPCRAWT
jgi:hypothetical protein